jgi:hypothetical protein
MLLSCCTFLPVCKQHIFFHPARKQAFNIRSNTGVKAHVAQPTARCNHEAQELAVLHLVLVFGAAVLAACVREPLLLQV